MFELVTQQLKSQQQYGRNRRQIRLKRERGKADETDEAVMVIKNVERKQETATKISTDFITEEVF